MKVAYIMPHSYENFYKKDMERFESPDDLDYNILTRSDHYPHRFCKASMMAGLEPTFYYLSSTAKTTKEFTHKYGYKMKKIPVNLKLPKYGKFGWEYSYDLLKELSKDDPDLIFVFSYIVNCLIPLDMYDIIAYYCKKNKYPLIARHGGKSAICKVKGYKLHYKTWIKKSTLNKANKIIVPSERELNVLNCNLEIKKDKLIGLRNPVDLDNFYEISKEKSAKVLNKDSAKKYILFVGRPEKDKGIFNILNVLPELIDSYKDIHLLIVGNGPYEEEVNRAVIDSGLQDYISFEGSIPHDSLKFYYNIADVFLIPSYAEGLPNVIQEAVACNTPIVGTDVGGIPDILSEGLGITIPVRDDSKLLSAVKQILDGKFIINKEKRKKLLDKWSMEKFGNDLKEIYKEIV